MSSGAFPDPEAKVRRADEHIETLDRLIGTFAYEAYSGDMYPDFWQEPSPPARGDVVIWADAVSAPPVGDG